MAFMHAAEIRIVELDREIEDQRQALHLARILADGYSGSIKRSAYRPKN
jgi:hypothetical protein